MRKQLVAYQDAHADQDLPLNPSQINQMRGGTLFRWISNNSSGGLNGVRAAR